ncbi:MAG: ATP-dependent DNA ligase, partial [Hyphomicrobium denitrificans]|nr:ATP-dependent DNA ligase [Hyphomicrobium denitrificans]
MRAFARLLDCLVYTQSRNRKTALLARYFRSTPDPDRGWALAALTDGIPIRLPLRRMVGDLTGRFIDPILYQLSRDYVGDTAETVALLWPDEPVDLTRVETTSSDPSPQGAEREEESAVPSTTRGRARREKLDDKSRQLSLDLTPTPAPSPQGGEENETAPLARKEHKQERRAIAANAADNRSQADTRSASQPRSEITDRPRSDVGHNSGEPAYLSLGNVIGEMANGTAAERTERLGQFLNALDASGRWALLKLLGGAPRVGVSARLARTALAEAYGRDVSEIEEIWHALEPPYLDLFAWLDGKAERPDPGLKPVFRPVMLAHPVEEEDWPKLA